MSGEQPEKPPVAAQKKFTENNKKIRKVQGYTEASKTFLANQRNPKVSVIQIKTSTQDLFIATGKHTDTSKGLEKWENLIQVNDDEKFKEFIQQVETIYSTRTPVSLNFDFGEVLMEACTLAELQNAGVQVSTTPIVANFWEAYIDTLKKNADQDNHDVLLLTQAKTHIDLFFNWILPRNNLTLFWNGIHDNVFYAVHTRPQNVSVTNPAFLHALAIAKVSKYRIITQNRSHVLKIITSMQTFQTGDLEVCATEQDADAFLNRKSYLLSELEKRQCETYYATWMSIVVNDEEAELSTPMLSALRGTERVLFIGTQFSNLYTSVYPPTRGRVVVCSVFVIACKYEFGNSQVSQPLNLQLIMPPHTSSDTLVFSLK
jgi:hypothetical protein